MRNRKRAQQKRREEFDSLGTAERIRRLSGVRDPSIIRKAIPDDWDGDEDALIKVTCLRRVGLNEFGEMSDIDEVVLMPPENARILQKSGAVEVLI